MNYKDLIFKTKSHMFQVDIIHPDLVHGAIGLSTEAGEILDKFKKSAFYGKSFTKEDIIDEAGDALWYIELMLSAVGSSINDAVTKNIIKLNCRYPDGWKPGDAINKDKAKEYEAMFGTERTVLS